MQLEQGCVYGPVWSRRFGWDMGINPLPTDVKLCTYDCIYCQYGLSQPLKGKHTVPDVDSMVYEWEMQLKKCSLQGIEVHHSTVSGNGEPTMHPHFYELASALTRARDCHAASVKLAVLSNGYRLQDPRIREAMSFFDEPIVKLDSVIPEKWKAINRPTVSFSLSRLLSNLREIKGVIIQSMFLKGKNDTTVDVTAWTAALAEIQPREVQIYTVTRTPAMPEAEPVSDSVLLDIAERTSRVLGIPVRAFV